MQQLHKHGVLSLGEAHGNLLHAHVKVEARAVHQSQRGGGAVAGQPELGTDWSHHQGVSPKPFKGAGGHGVRLRAHHHVLLTYGFL